MRISDELREWADVHCGEECVEYLGLLADRIDREMVELPKDKGGNPIHVGDTVYLESGSKADVKSIEFSQGEHSIVFTARGKGFFPSHLSNERPDSLERIADEMENAVGCAETSARGDEAPWVFAASVEKWAERLRKLAKEASDETD